MPDTYIKLPDGSYLHFLDGTPPDEMLRATQAHMDEGHPHLSDPPTPPFPAPGYTPGMEKDASPHKLIPLAAMAVPGLGIEAAIPRIMAAMGLSGGASYAANRADGVNRPDAFARAGIDGATYGAGPEALGSVLGLMAPGAVKLGLRGRAPAEEIPKIAKTILDNDIVLPKGWNGADRAASAAQADVATATKNAQAARATAMMNDEAKHVADLRAKLTTPPASRPALGPAVRQEATLAGEPPTTWEPEFGPDGKVKLNADGTPRWVPSIPKGGAKPFPEIPTYDRLQPSPGRATFIAKPERVGAGDIYTKGNEPWDVKFNKKPSTQTILEPLESASPDRSGPGVLLRDVADEPAPGPWRSDAPAEPPLKAGRPIAATQEMIDAATRADDMGAAADAMSRPRASSRFGGLVDAGILGGGFALHHPVLGVGLEAALQASHMPGVMTPIGQGLKAAPTVMPSLMRGVDFASGGKPTAEETALMALLSSLDQSK